MDTAQLLDALNWRYATKQFDASKEIPAETWDALVQSLVLAPSSFGVQPWKFIVVKDEAKLKQLSAASWGQTQPVDASHYVVLAILKDVDEAYIGRFIADAAATRGIPVEELDGYKKVLLGFLGQLRKNGAVSAWSARQTYIALGQFMTSAAVLGIDTCPMEGINPAQYDEILGLTDTPYATVCGCAAGYRSDEDKYAATPKVRWATDQVVQTV